MRIVTPEQVQQLLAAIGPREPFGERDRALIQLALHTGLRAHELCALDVGQVSTWDFIPRQWLEVTGKGGRRRQIPLNASARSAIIEIIHFNRARGFAVAQESPLLLTRCHKRLPTRTLRDLVQKYRERADLDVKCSPHTFRHTFASRLAGCAHLPVVQTLLGHRYLSSTQVYTHTSPAELSQGVELLAQA